MAKRIFLHVATTKTGTTFLQRVLWAHRDQLLAQHVLLPGAGVGDHFKASVDVREEPHRVVDPTTATGAWSRLVDDMAAWEGDALVSHELFASATADQAGRAIAMLDRAEVHVIVTARDLARQIPAEWQEHLKHRSVLTFPEFVHSVRTDERGPFSPNGYHFWHAQDLSGVFGRWRADLPSERLHVVTVPRPGAESDGLWKRFTGLVGIDGATFDLGKGRSNSSVGAEQAELLRLLNSRLGSRLPLPGPYPELVKALLAHQLLAERPGTRFGLVGADREFAVERAKAMVVDLERLQVDVVGDLLDLVPDAQGEDVSGDAHVSRDAVLDEAVEALAGVLERFWSERTRRQRLRRELDEARTWVKELQSQLQQAESGLSGKAVRLARKAARRPSD